jgi:hypothetical protein
LSDLLSEHQEMPIVIGDGECYYTSSYFVKQSQSVTLNQDSSISVQIVSEEVLVTQERNQPLWIWFRFFSFIILDNHIQKGEKMNTILSAKMIPKFKLIFILMFILIMVLIICSGCDWDPFGIKMKKTLATLNYAIDTLNTQSVNWQKVLIDTRDMIFTDGIKSIASQVDGVLTGAISDTRVEASCYTDFLRDRVREALIQIRATITDEKVILTPVFCDPNPKTIDMSLDPTLRTSLEISGYNIETNSVQLFLVDNLGQKIDASSKIAYPSEYILTVDLGLYGVPLSGKSVMLEFVLPDETTRTVNITQPFPNPRYDYLVELSTQNRNNAAAAEDGHVWITLVGTKSRTPEQEVMGSLDKQSGHGTTVFTNQEDIGEVQYAIIRYDDGEDNNAWELAWISVINQTTQQTIWFPVVDRWYGGTPNQSYGIYP